MPETPRLVGDSPIQSRDADLLERGPLVRLIAAEIAAAPIDDGFVVSLTGPWGSGKSSLANLVVEELADSATVVRFNRWLFSGAEQLVSRFFSELSAQLEHRAGKRMRKIAKGLATYGGAVSPLAPVLLGPAGAIVGAGTQAISSAGAASTVSVLERQQRLKRLLRARDRRIVVLIDDIDRLAADEIVEVMRLVKLVGDLPGGRVPADVRAGTRGAALGDRADDGRAYLEKIVQAPHEMPMLAEERLRHLAEDALKAALGSRKLTHFDMGSWRPLFTHGVVPLMRTLRDARRYANVAQAGLELTEGEVAAHDILALEALRVFEPAVHDALSDMAGLLTDSDIDLRQQTEIDRDRTSAHRSSFRSRVEARRRSGNSCGCCSRPPETCLAARATRPPAVRRARRDALRAATFSTST